MVIAAKQNQMHMGERLAVLPAEDADGDGLIVDHREALCRAVKRRSQ
jgi:hypothetical protein